MTDTCSADVFRVGGPGDENSQQKQTLGRKVPFGCQLAAPTQPPILGLCTLRRSPRGGPIQLSLDGGMAPAVRSRTCASRLESTG